MGKLSVPEFLNKEVVYWKLRNKVMQKKIIVLDTSAFLWDTTLYP